MTGRFDPVRDSVISPLQRTRDLEAESAQPSSHSPAETYPIEESYRERRPSRSASIADILNDDDQHPSIGRSHSAGFGAGSGSGSNGSAGPSHLNRFGSSPLNATVKLPPSSSSPYLSPTLTVSELPTHEYSRYSPESYGQHLRRQSSTHSTTSSAEHHSLPYNAQATSQKIHRSSSVLNLLNSDTPRIVDDGKMPSSSSPASFEVPPRARGPSFAGGLSILSPTTEGITIGRTSSGSYLQRESMNQSPLHRSVTGPSPQLDHPRPRQNSLSSNHSYFAVPDIPTRSPEVFRNRNSLPNVTPSPEQVHISIPSHQLMKSDFDLREQRYPRASHQQPSPMSTVGYYTGHGHNQQQPHKSSIIHTGSPSTMTPHYQPQSPMDLPPTPGSYHPSNGPITHLPQPLTPSAIHHRTEGERMAEHHLASIHSQPPRPWMEDNRSTSRMSQSNRPSPPLAEQNQIIPNDQVEWTSLTAPNDKRDLVDESSPPSKRRKESESLGFEEVNYTTASLEGAQVDTAPQESSAPKRGRPKGRKSISKGDEGVKQRRASVAEKKAVLKAEKEDQEERNGQSKLHVTDTSQAEAESILSQEDIKEEVKMETLVAPVPPSSYTSMTSERSSVTTAASTVPAVSKVAYRPSKRVSVPTTIRMPVTSKQVDEMRHQCRNLLRTEWQEANPTVNDGWNLIVSEFEAQISQPPEKGASDVASGRGELAADKKRKRERQEADESNARLVAQHYNSRQDQGLDARQHSLILPLRNFNNWIKSVIIGSYAKKHGRVLDLGGGKGGDLYKWDKAQIGEYILCDIASVSVKQAESRYNERKCHFQAKFFSFDCFSTSLADNIPLKLLEPRFDNVTLQFCLHYGWESVQKAQLMLENIARYLKPGGVFVGTIPNADLLRSKLSKIMDSSSSSSSSSIIRSGANSTELTFGNQYYTVRFDQTNVKDGKFPAFGHKYYFTLVDAVDDVAEYVVDWDQFVSLAGQNGLECIFKKTFEQVWREEGQMEKFRGLTRKMKIAADGGGSNGIPMNEELWEAAGLYLAFAFEKKSRP